MDPDHLVVATGLDALRRSHPGRSPANAEQAPPPSGGARRGRRGTARSGNRRLVAPDRRKGPAWLAVRALSAAAGRVRGARSDLHKARPDPLVRRGSLPCRARLRVPPVPGPGAARAFRRGTPDRRTRPGTAAHRGLQRVRPCTPRRGVDRSGPRGNPATGEQVVVKVQRPTVASLVRKDLAAMSCSRPFSSAGSP